MCTVKYETEYEGSDDALDTVMEIKWQQWIWKDFI